VLRPSPRLLGLAAILAIGGCGSRHGATADAGVVEPAWPGLTIDLTPDPAASEVAIALRLSGDAAAKVTALDVARDWADTRGASAILRVEARDGEGDLPLRDGPEDGADRSYLPTRAPRGGELAVRYRVHANGDTSRFGLHLSRERLSGVGHAFLLVPRIEASIPVRIRWHLDALPAGATAATSFGVGAEQVLHATSEELGQAAYLAGPTRVEEALPSLPSPTLAIDDAGALKAPAAGARLVVLGASGFDTRAAYYWSVTALSTLDRFFENAANIPGKPADPFSFLLVAAPGLGGDHDGAALTGSFALWFDQARAFDAGLKSVVAHELTHRYLGGALRLEDQSGKEAVWFSEGFTVHLARRWLLESGLVTPRDVLGDLRRTMDDKASPERPAACATSPGGRSQEEYRRGARYAALTDAAIQKASSGKRGIDDLVRELLARGRAEQKGAFPVDAWREAVQRELGDAGGGTFDRLIVRGERAEVPDSAFGPCFHRVARDEDVLDLGFDRRSLARSPAILSGVIRGGLADKAGLRDGALVLSAKLPDEGATAPKGGKKAEAVLTLAGRGGGKKVRYRPWSKRHVVVWEARECDKRR
jgi:predicted metalloprotease with PDZ domain